MNLFTLTHSTPLYDLSIDSTVATRDGPLERGHRNRRCREIALRRARPDGGGDGVNRRELVAGIGSVGVLAGAGGLFWRGPPSFVTDRAGSDDGDDGGPLEVETIDAAGSEAGTISVPLAEGATVATFFVTGCGSCQAQMPRLAQAREQLIDRHDDAVRFLSVTYQTPETMPPEDLREWWHDHDGEWYVGYDSGLASTYGAVGYPVTIVVDADGESHWQEIGVQSPRTIVDAAESVLEG